MLQATKDIFSDEILHQAIKLFGGTKEKCKDLGGFEAFVYELEIDNKYYILKITHTIRRTVKYILGELEFVNYLSSHGVPTSKAVASLQNNLIETIDAPDGGLFLAYLYEKAEGALTTYKDWSDDFITTWGQLAGMMNRLAKEFKPSSPDYTREQWDDDDIFNFEQHIPKSKSKTISNGRKIIEHVKTFPKNKYCYGLVHGDLHHGNFFNNNGVIHPFDFDDCGYNYFINDIAMPLFYALPHTYVKKDYGGISNIEFGSNFLFNFLNGYKKEMRLEKEWILRIPEFLKIRAMLLFTIFHQIWAEDSLDDKKIEIIERLRCFVDGDEILLDIDYGKFV